MAEACGVHPQNINRYLEGKSDPSRVIIKLIDFGLDPDWARTGRGQMMRGEQPENGRRTDVKQVVEEGKTPYNAVYDGNRMMMDVIGSRMTPDGSCIAEGDHIIIDKSVEPREGDYVLAKVGDAPGIIAWTPDAPQKPLGVIIKLTREYR